MKTRTGLAGPGIPWRRTLSISPLAPGPPVEAAAAALRGARPARYPCLDARWRPPVHRSLLPDSIQYCRRLEPAGISPPSSSARPMAGEKRSPWGAAMPSASSRRSDSPSEAITSLCRARGAASTRRANSAPTSTRRRTARPRWIGSPDNPGSTAAWAPGDPATWATRSGPWRPRPGTLNAMVVMIASAENYTVSHPDGAFGLETRLRWSQGIYSQKRMHRRPLREQLAQRFSGGGAPPASCLSPPAPARGGYRRRRRAIPFYRDILTHDQPDDPFLGSQRPQRRRRPGRRAGSPHRRLVRLLSARPPARLCRPQSRRSPAYLTIGPWFHAHPGGM